MVSSMMNNDNKLSWQQLNENKVTLRLLLSGRASESEIQRSEVLFLVGFGIFLCPTLVTFLSAKIFYLVPQGTLPTTVISNVVENVVPAIIKSVDEKEKHGLDVLISTENLGKPLFLREAEFVRFCLKISSNILNR